MWWPINNKQVAFFSFFFFYVLVGWCPSSRAFQSSPIGGRAFQTRTTTTTTTTTWQRGGRGGVPTVVVVATKDVSRCRAAQDDNDDDETTTTRNTSSSSSRQQQQQDFLDRAQQLRQEADALEQALRGGSSKTTTSPTTATTAASLPPVVVSLPDSTWTLTYRFADQPVPRDNDNNNNNDSNDNNENAVSPPTFYSGKLTVRFRADGFTDLVSASSSSSSSSLQFTKVWGWDLEQSEQDKKDYILFSADVQFPGTTNTQRVYFQAQQEQQQQQQTSPSSIVLVDGTVTMKQDIVEQPGAWGMWGLFSPRGILAQFRYTGEFVAKPAAVTTTTGDGNA